MVNASRLRKRCSSITLPPWTIQARRIFLPDPALLGLPDDICGSAADALMLVLAAPYRSVLMAANLNLLNCACPAVYITWVNSENGTLRSAIIVTIP